MRVLLIRHGLTDANASNVIQGHQPTALNAAGLHQARLLAVRLAERGPRFDVLISSDLPRAMQTAEPIAKTLGLAIQSDARWRERFFGPWEGTSRSKAEIWRVAAGEFDPSGAESSADFQKRICAVLQDLPKTHREQPCVAVVTHGGPCRMVLRMLAGGTLPQPPAQARPQLCMIANCSIMHLDCDAEGRWTLLQVNDSEHLPVEEQTSADAG